MKSQKIGIKTWLACGVLVACGLGAFGFNISKIEGPLPDSLGFWIGLFVLIAGSAGLLFSNWSFLSLRFQGGLIVIAALFCLTALNGSAAIQITLGLILWFMLFIALGGARLNSRLMERSILKIANRQNGVASKKSKQKRRRKKGPNVIG